LTYPSEKYEFVSWDDEIPKIFPLYSQYDGKVIQNSMVPVTTNQPFISFYVVLMEVLVGLCQGQASA
jgi:hypothetical protein